MRPVTSSRLVRPDGTSLYVERHDPEEGARAALVMLHGFSSHSGLYRETAMQFAAAGLAVTAFDCRGHGQSQGARGYVERFADFRGDLDAVVRDARARHPTLPLFLSAHSHGGIVALDYAQAEGGQQIDGLVLVAPWFALKMKVPVIKLLMARVLDRLWPRLVLSNEIHIEDGTRNPELVARFGTDPLIHHVATPRWFMEVRRTHAHLRARASRLRVPTLMVLAGDDRIVSTDAALRFAALLGRYTDVDIKVYGELFHELYLEPGGDRVVGDITRWLEAHRPAATRAATPALTGEAVPART